MTGISNCSQGTGLGRDASTALRAAPCQWHMCLHVHCAFVAKKDESISEGCVLATRLVSMQLRLKAAAMTACEACMQEVYKCGAPQPCRYLARAALIAPSKVVLEQSVFQEGQESCTGLLLLVGSWYCCYIESIFNALAHCTA